VSSTTQVAVLAPLGQDAAPRRRAADAADRPVIRLIAFSALGLYGVVRWGTLMNPAPTWRLLGLLALAVALAGVGPLLLDRERSVAALRGRTESVSAVGAPLALLAFLAIFPIAGVPLGWVTHLRVAVTADGIGQGLSALPGILVPYSGINDWAQTVILLGAALLLLDAALLLAFAPPALGDVRRAGVALPLIALVVVPATLVHPHLAYLQGLLLFALLAFFMWGERVPPDRRGGVVLALAATGAIGMIVAPALDQHSPWIDYEAFTRGFTPAHVERFDWTQRYGPLVWPRTGNNVLDVAATPKVWPGEYWKTENLDTFDGSGWVAGAAGGAAQPPISPRTVARYTQTLTVTIRAMQTNQVIATGTAAPPQHLGAPALPGSSPGTWFSQNRLGPGDSYTVQVYAPHPSSTRLARAGDNYPLGVQQSDLMLTMPQQHTFQPVAAQTVLFPVFGSRGVAPRDLTDPDQFDGLGSIEGSPYAQVYSIAQRLSRGAGTPYAYVERVMNYLAGNGYSYDEYPPPTAYPLATFLLLNRIGYCQQFAGSMALLLRMGGIPARVATGFTTGAYDSATKRWLVSDVDAHAWVEAWFPHYGWITFDPTPPAAPARGGRSAINSGGALGGNSGVSKLGGRNPAAAGAAAAGPTSLHSGGSLSPVVIALLAVLAVALVLAVFTWSRSGGLDADALLSELERALSRSGRPIADGVTLAALERRFRTSPQAAAYVRTLRMARFGGDASVPTLRQRRALRAQLRAGLGLGGALRALWALPPRRERARWRRRRDVN
jgi:transglutaminase-like putative cysteine protease